MNISLCARNSSLITSKIWVLTKKLIIKIEIVHMKLRSNTNFKLNKIQKELVKKYNMKKKNNRIASVEGERGKNMRTWGIYGIEKDRVILEKIVSKVIKQNDLY